MLRDEHFRIDENRVNANMPRHLMGGGTTNIFHYKIGRGEQVFEPNILKEEARLFSLQPLASAIEVGDIGAGRSPYQKINRRDFPALYLSDIAKMDDVGEPRRRDLDAVFVYLGSVVFAGEA